MTTPSPRRRARLVAAILAAALGSTVTAGPAPAATAIKVGNSSAPAFNFLPLALGIEQHFFADNGVDVTEIDLEGSAKLHQAMTAGAIDLGLGAGTDIAFLVKGAPEMAVGAIALTPALFGVIVPYDSPVHQLSDLKGKRIGVSTVGSLTQWLAFQIAKKEGWDPKSFTFIADGSTYPAQLAALETNAIDAQISGAALGWNLEAQKKGRLLAPASDWVGAFLQNVVFASNDIIQKNPDAVRGFLKGWYQGVAFMAQHRAKTIALARERDKFSEEIEQKQYDTVMPSFSTDGTFPAAAVDPVRSSFVELGILPTEPDMSQYMTERFLPSKK
ncbi:MAG TPA: ABC transporter substrate-binding protein [Stellaceae bacterium]|jgi:ABC-type nitrate/sulfonate/bicarbonate transport system substrate-binding protein